MSPERILFFDDEPNVLEGIRQTLRNDDQLLFAASPTRGIDDEIVSRLDQMGGDYSPDLLRTLGRLRFRENRTEVRRVTVDVLTPDRSSSRTSPVWRACCWCYRAG